MKTITEIIQSYIMLDDMPFDLFVKINEMIVEASQQAFEAGQKWDFDSECSFYTEFNDYLKEVK